MIARKRLLAEAKRLQGKTARFLADIVACPSHSGTEKRAADRIRREMKAVGFDEAFTDKLGNVIGRVGKGRKVLLYDSHIDTVGVGDPAAWKGRDPFKLRSQGGFLWGRGACDNKGSMACMVHGAGLLKKLGLTGDFTLYVTGSTFEEDCDGLGQEFLIKKSIRTPHLVCLGEPTDLNVYRGHRGRMEIAVHVAGRSCHASAPERGDNPVYKMTPLIQEIEALNQRLKDDAFLGKGSVAVTKIECQTPSLNAVPDSCTIYLDRRLTVGETKASALAEIRALPSAQGARVELLPYEATGYTGQKVKSEKYFPTWILPEDHPGVRGAVEAATAVRGSAPRIGRWAFSTNGIASMGRLGIPTIGFGAGNEVDTHSATERIASAHLPVAVAFYALFPSMVAPLL
jgi:putative selenium metabolism hydrolase